ncbi:MAG: histone deacetylase family protein [Pseudomonadota bacterium]|nr:histone deacetylase family protein [Pseudomonadota bacterium]
MILTHPACALHDMGPGHPESPARLAAVLSALDAPPLAAIRRLLAPAASIEQLRRAHDVCLIERVFASAPISGLSRLDGDTAMNPNSLDAALHAAGAVVAGVDAVLQGQTDRVFCAVRPPGHHATHVDAMGFCLFNNVAVGAAHAMALGLERVAIIDFDVHHGNGTQNIFADDPRVLYASSHQWPLYPGTGAESEHGVGNIHNAVLMPGARSLEFREAWMLQLLPAIAAFKPQLMLISAGFDAHRLDPLAQLNLGAEDFAWVTRALVAIAERHAMGRVVSTLEGGYSLTALRECTAAHCQALFGIVSALP